MQYNKKLLDHQNDLSFLPERTNIEKVEKLVANLDHKTEYVIHIRNSKQALNHGKIHRVIEFNQHAWLKPYIDSSRLLRKKIKKMILRKIVFS